MAEVSNVSFQYDSSGIAGAQVSLQQTAATTPGYHPAHGAVAMMGGALIANNVQQASHRRRLNLPLSPLQEWIEENTDAVYDAEHWQLALADVPFELSGSSPFGESAGAGTVLIEPQIYLLSNYRVLHTRLRLSFLSHDGEVLYGNSYHVFSKSLPLETEDPVAGWLEDEALLLRQALSQAKPLLAKQIALDLESDMLWLSAAETQGIRYTNGKVMIYERGRILSGPIDNTLTYRSLDGSIRTVQFDELLAP
jgi:hypothetical protein